MYLLMDLLQECNTVILSINIASYYSIGCWKLDSVVCYVHSIEVQEKIIAPQYTIYVTFSQDQRNSRDYIDSRLTT